jgi:hypothetical protein
LYDWNGAAIHNVDITLHSEDENTCMAHNYSRDMEYDTERGHVCYTTINGAIDNASDCNEIEVYPGTHYENVDFDGKSITVRSSDPCDWDVVATTIIDGNDLDAVVRFDGTETSDCKLLGFTITNGYGSADSDGGGISGLDTSANIANCIIKENIAQRHGGGIRKVDGDIDNCIIFGNSTENQNGGGLVGCHGTISNCLIYNNTATLVGGAMVNCDGGIVNCSIVDNTAGNNTGGLGYCDGTITNCIIWDNSGTVSDQVTFSSTPTYSCIQNWSSGGTGNIATDPNFVDAANDDYHLNSVSPCIDVGDSGGTYTGQLDIDGDNRVIDIAGKGDGTVDVDMGADEYEAP